MPDDTSDVLHGRRSSDSTFATGAGAFHYGPHANKSVQYITDAYKLLAWLHWAATPQRSCLAWRCWLAGKTAPSPAHWLVRCGFLFRTLGNSLCVLHPVIGNHPPCAINVLFGLALTYDLSCIAILAFSIMNAHFCSWQTPVHCCVCVGSGTPLDRAPFLEKMLSTVWQSRGTGHSLPKE